MAPSTLTNVLLMLAVQAPLIVVCFLGLIMVCVQMQRAPRAAILAACGLLLFLIVALLQPLLAPALNQMINGSSSNLNSRARMLIGNGIAAAFNIPRAVGIVLLVCAAFVGRPVATFAAQKLGAICLAVCATLMLLQPAFAQQPATKQPVKLDTSRGDKMLAEYFAAETKKLQDNCLAEVKTLDDWKSHRDEYRRQLHEMLGLDPLPEKTDLKPVITGKVEHEEFVVEKLHFQSRPGLYVTGNLYLPKKIEKPLPTILYVCGHSRVLGKDGKTPMGAKAGYQHHGAWYARNGYACLTIDTLQLGEIEGIHHGTHRYGMWWWLNRGYTPAGVEAWNCVRALDYLETRPEIDKTRFGVTGRSGGGAYSWWIAALDERINVAVPTAGITDLQNHVVDGCVEGHCDCMFMVNTYRWDYPQVAALVAPRPLLISNTDSDGIFPLDGVVRTFDKVRRIYRLFDSEKKGTSNDIALNISPGPHKDTQELNTHEFRWFNHYLKKDDSPIDSRAPKYFEPEQLKVFDKLPEDQINTNIHETFVARASSPQVPVDQAAWERTRGGAMKVLRDELFRGWPDGNEALNERETINDENDGVLFSGGDFTSQGDVRLQLYIACSEALDNEFAASSKTRPDLFVLNVLDDDGWRKFLATIRPGFEGVLQGENLPPADKNAYQSWANMIKANRWVMVYVAPRGVGSTAFDQSARKQVQNRRRSYLLGETLDSQQVWDIRRAIQALKSGLPKPGTPILLQAQGSMAGVALYASLFEPDIKHLNLYDLPQTHRVGPTFLNVERFLDMPQAVAMAAEWSKVAIYQDDDTGWEYPQAVAKVLNWPADQIQIRRKPAEK